MNVKNNFFVVISHQYQGKELNNFLSLGITVENRKYKTS